MNRPGEMRPGFGSLLLSSLLLLCGGCIDVDFARVVRLRRPPVDFETLRVGETDLELALDQLGAPLLVRELRDGAGLVWGWFRGSTWGVQVSVPIGDDSGSVSYEDTSAQVKGLLLLFDRNWVLTSVREGNLRELTNSSGAIDPRVWTRSKIRSVGPPNSRLETR